MGNRGSGGVVNGRIQREKPTAEGQTQVEWQRGRGVEGESHGWGGALKRKTAAGEQGGGDGRFAGGFLVWVRNLPLCQPRLDIK